MHPGEGNPLPAAFYDPLSHLTKTSPILLSSFLLPYSLHRRFARPNPDDTKGRFVRLMRPIFTIPFACTVLKWRS
jgi:hypothetical protein